uniref:Ig-like domain-containing protein n=1 Tax=Castor canadensis TaxID=51338 RepID=A0A8C0W5R6_CASCN
MLSVTILLLGSLFTLKGSGAQSVTQIESHVTVSEGAPLELRCNYSYGATPFLFWYIQYPNQGLQLLLKYIGGDLLVKGIKGFEAEFRKSETSFHLKKASAHLSDTAEYFCAVSGTVPGATGKAEHKLPKTQGICYSRAQPNLFLVRFLE